MGRDAFGHEEREAIDAHRKKSPQERIDALVKKGIIDSNGKVLVCMPVFASDSNESKQA